MAGLEIDNRYVERSAAKIVNQHFELALGRTKRIEVAQMFSKRKRRGGRTPLGPTEQLTRPAEGASLDRLAALETAQVLG